jgi:lipoprotein-anchoring transpeptidase ErfK/SrfK
MMHIATRHFLSLGLVAITAVAASAAKPIETPGDSPLSLVASLSSRTLTVTRDGAVVKTYAIAVGSERHRTPTGSFAIHHIVWNPSWVPPDAKWAQGKTPKAPGHPANPMKLVKMFFQEPDYYIHGTDAVESLGQAASHGCLRMDPDEAGELALMVMDNAGVSRDWDWVKGLLHLGEERSVTLQLSTPLRIEP